MAFQPRQREAQEVDVAAKSEALFDKPVHERGPDWFGPPARGPNAAVTRPTMRPSRSTTIARRSSSTSAPTASFSVVPAFGEDEPTLHDVLRLLHQVEIDVALLGDAVAAVAKLDGVDRFADQRSV